MQIFAKQLSKTGPKIGIAPAIALINPKTAANAGMVVRLASVYGFKQVWFTGKRVGADISARGRMPREERMKGYKDVEIINYEYPLEQFGPGVTPVAIEVRDNAVPLHLFEHPENPVYVFGPEDGSIPKTVLQHCHRFVVIPGNHCLNLATAVATLLWDRVAKGYADGTIDPTSFTTPGEHEGRGFIGDPASEIFGASV
jgi:tRNA(Leu) C34 or U34 (ribose-2'-O)-methylase TrmL